jgi:hypothetical protein
MAAQKANCLVDKRVRFPAAPQQNRQFKGMSGAFDGALLCCWSVSASSVTRAAVT